MYGSTAGVCVSGGNITLHKGGTDSGDRRVPGVRAIVGTGNAKAWQTGTVIAHLLYY